MVTGTLRMAQSIGDGLMILALEQVPPGTSLKIGASYVLLSSAEHARLTEGERIEIDPVVLMPQLPLGDLMRASIEMIERSEGQKVRAADRSERSSRAGYARAAALPAQRRSEIARIAAQARWGKRKEA